MGYFAMGKLAVKAVATSMWMVRKWQTMPAERRDALKGQAQVLILAAARWRVARSAESSASDPPKDFHEAVASVRSDESGKEMAHAIVKYLRDVPTATLDEIANAVDAVGADDSTFKTAMKVGRDDGYVRRVGVNLHGVKWDTTEWADGELVNADHVRALEDRIVEFVNEFGLVSLDHICAGLGMNDDTPEFRAALERAVDGDQINWFCHGRYGLSLDALDDFEPVLDIWAESFPGGAAGKRSGAFEEIKAAMKSLVPELLDRGKSEGHAGSGGNEDPIDRLVKVKELHEAGVLTDDEFAAKKNELLSSI